jgi:hypothetical protein
MSTTTCCMDSMMLKLLLPPNTLQQAHTQTKTGPSHPHRFASTQYTCPVLLACDPGALFTGRQPIC